MWNTQNKPHQGPYQRDSLPSIHSAGSGSAINHFFGNRNGHKRTAQCTANYPTVQGPPPSFNHRKEAYQTSLQVIEKDYPDLLPLAETGQLYAVPRPADYVERREDGYQEPRMVFVLGTAHTSAESVENVTRVIRAVAPQNVVVELCRSRAGIMYSDPSNLASLTDQGSPEPTSTNTATATTTGASTPQVSTQQLESQVVTQGSSAAALTAAPTSSTTQSAPKKMEDPNTSPGLLPTLLLMQSLMKSPEGSTRVPFTISGVVVRLALSLALLKLGSGGEATMGDDARAARRGAQEFDAQVVLGDRPIEITLRRAWGALPLLQRMRLTKDLIITAILPSQGKAQRLADQASKDEGAMGRLMRALEGSYPELIAPLYHERDRYYAWSLKRSKAVDGCDRVVGVCGKAHMKGVIYALTNDQENLRFKDLVRIPEDSKQKYIVDFAIVIGGEAVFIFLLFQLFKLVVH